jgi:hypothetical protein
METPTSAYFFPFFFDEVFFAFFPVTTAGI